MAEFGAKFKSKAEAFHFVQNELGAYCSSRDTMTVWHLKDMISGAKGIIKSNAIKHLSIPQYESLSLEKILDWAKQNHRSVLSLYLPSIDRELQKLPRQ